MFQERDLPTPPAWTPYDTMKINCLSSRPTLSDGDTSNLSQSRFWCLLDFKLGRGHKRLFWYCDTWYMLLSSRFKIDVITTTGAACKQFWFVKILKTNFVTLKSGIWNLQFISAKLRNRCILLELLVWTTFLHLRYLTEAFRILATPTGSF